MKNTKNLNVRMMAAGAAMVAAAAMTGCNGGLAGTAKQVLPMGAISGTVHGGQQPIFGATIHLYKVNTTGYPGDAGVTANTDLLASANVTTSKTGYFGIPYGSYSCSPGDQLYMVSTGGDTQNANPTPTTLNNQAVLMAALGDCSTVLPTSSSDPGRQISMNEVTTVGSVFALSPFMSDYSHVSVSSTNTAGLIRAFVNADKLVNSSNGYAGGPKLATNATAPTQLLYTLANIVASCVNTPTGGSAPGGTSDNTACGNLFAYTTVSGVTPTDTVGLALAMAQNPTQNVGSIFIYNGSGPSSVFAPSLTSAPTDWTTSVTYSGFSVPKTVTVDANGNIWVANSSNNTVTLQPQGGGSPVTITGNNLSGPSAIAIDASGNAWVTNSGSSGANGVSVFSSNGSVVGSYTTAANPNSIAFDSTGNAWVTSAAASNNVTELSSSGALLNTLSSGGTPVAVVINAK